MTKPKAKRKGIVVTVLHLSNWLYAVAPSPKRGPDSVWVCRNWLVRAGMKPLKPGESRKVRVTVEDVT